MSDQNEKELRVVLQQPSLRRYRVPVFRELAARKGIDLVVVHGTDEEHVADLSAGDPTGYFESINIPMKRRRMLGREIRWYPPQWKYATRKTTDVLVLPWDLACLTLVPALIKARLLGVPVVLWGHGYSKRERWWRKWLRRTVGRLARANVFYNKRIARQHVDDGYSSKRVFVALNSLDQAPIQKERAWWLHHRDKLLNFRRDNDIEHGPVILLVSRLYADNRFDLLLEAASRLTGRFPSLRVVIIGTGPDLPRLEHMAHSLGLSDAVRFPGAIYEEDAIAPWFVSADVFCYPANVGLSILHAFGYGLPVVTTDRLEAQGPEIEAMEHDVNGLMYQHGDIDSLTGTLATLLDDRELRIRLSEGALQTVRKKYSIKRMVDGLQSAILYAAEFLRDR